MKTTVKSLIAVSALAVIMSGTAFAKVTENKTSSKISVQKPDELKIVIIDVPEPQKPAQPSKPAVQPKPAPKPAQHAKPAPKPEPHKHHDQKHHDNCHENLGTQITKAIIKSILK